MKEKELQKRMWKPQEDTLLKTYVEIHGEGNWSGVSQKLGLQRDGKSCRLRWKNYLRPDIKHGSMSMDEEDLIIRMHKLLGNRWSLIAGRLPGRTDNEVKNYWNTHLCKTENRVQPKRKAAELNENHENSEKRAKVAVIEQSEQEHHHGSTQDTKPDTTNNGLKEENNPRINNDESKDDENWSGLTAGDLLASTGAGNRRGLDFGCEFMVSDGQLEWDNAAFHLFDGFGINWEDTLPMP